MLMLFTITLLAGLTLLGILLQKTYGQVPAKELKRRVQAGDAGAQAMYRVVAYGLSLKVFLWILTALSTAGLFYVVARSLPWPLALLAIIGLFAIGFTWLPNTQATAASRQLARWLAPSIAWILNYAHAPLQAGGQFVRNHSTLVSHTNLYQKEDLIELLEQQERQTDNRMSKQEIDIAVHALSFGDMLVRDIFIPVSQVVSVKLQDSLGPILMGELHSSGHSRFPVYDGKPSNVVGVLYLHDLLQKKQGGKVKDIYQKHVVYVHEEQNLFQTLQAFIKTKRHLFVVVNRFEEVIGIVTIEDVLEQVIGQPIVDEFDQYEDLRAVAARLAAKVHKEQKHQDPEVPEDDKL
ncbi:MAG: hemolysin (HlyC) family protein [Patescibacteria group bacterium]|nr:hemolysin (HlyC) family protein [Patescibacteria group bacterium]